MPDGVLRGPSAVREEDPGGVQAVVEAEDKEGERTIAACKR